MNESTSYFVYGLIPLNDRRLTSQIMSGVVWKTSMSDLDFDDFDGKAILLKAEYVPGNKQKRLISRTEVDTNILSKAYMKNNIQSKMFGINESLPTQLEADEYIDRLNNLFTKVEMTMQPGAVKPSRFECVKIPNFGENIERLETFLKEADLFNYIPPRKGTSSTMVATLGGGSLLNIATSGGYGVLGESLKEKLQLGYRGSWFTPLWVYLYEIHKGESMFVEFDCDIKEMYHAFELPSGLRVSSNKTIMKSDDGKKTICEIEGQNLHILAKLFDELKGHGNVGHSFTFYINKNSKSEYSFRGNFDGDGSDYIFRIELNQESKK